MHSILIVNSGARPVPRPHISDLGGYKLIFMELTHPEQLYKLQGQVFDDVVWVNRLSWNDPYREEIEWAVKTRMVNRGT